MLLCCWYRVLLFVLASTLDTDAEMVITAHELKHIYIFLTVASTVAFTFVVLYALTKPYVVCFVITFWVLDGADGMHASKAHDSESWS